LFEETLFLPGLKAVVQDTTTNAKPIFVNSLPLTACPQDVPNPGQDSPVIRRRASASSLFGWFGKELFDFPPKLAGQLEIVYIRRFCVMLFTQDVSSLLMVVLAKPILARYVFFTSFLIYG
jgi:hypothetical protein